MRFALLAVAGWLILSVSCHGQITSEDILGFLQASDRESLAELTAQAIAAVEAVTEDIQLLPAKEEAASG